MELRLAMIRNKTGRNDGKVFFFHEMHLTGAGGRGISISILQDRFGRVCVCASVDHFACCHRLPSPSFPHFLILSHSPAVIAVMASTHTSVSFYKSRKHAYPHPVFLLVLVRLTLFDARSRATVSPAKSVHHLLSTPEKMLLFGHDSPGNIYSFFNARRRSITSKPLLFSPSYSRPGVRDTASK